MEVIQNAEFRMQTTLESRSTTESPVNGV